MKIAVLMLAHKNIDQLERLISVLDHPSIDVYIHLDKKSSISPLDFRNHNVRFTKIRYDISLFDFSMVQAEIELLKTALAYERYGYYILLSGQCYPLRHVNDIYDFLCRSYPKPLIEVISPEFVTMYSHIFRYPYVMKNFRTRSEAFLKKHLSNRSIYPYKYIPEGIALLASVIKGFFVKSPKRRLREMGIEPYFGSQWWILPDVAIDEILPLYGSADFCNCIRDSFSCDETFFQTAIMTNADRLGIKLDENGCYRMKKWFTIFSHNHPILLTHQHYAQMCAPNKLFARKFDMDADSMILDMLDQHSFEMLGKEIQD